MSYPNHRTKTESTREWRKGQGNPSDGYEQVATQYARKKLQGDDFLNHSDQEEAQETAVDLFKRYGDGGDNSDLTAGAVKTHPALEHRPQMAKDLHK